MSLKRKGLPVLALLFALVSKSTLADAINAFVTTSAGQSIDITLRLDYNSINSVSASNGATVLVNQTSPGANGTVIFNYTPPAGFVGADSFSYTVVYNAVNTQATVTVQVGALQKPGDPASLVMLREMEKICSAASGGQAPASLVDLCSEIASASPEELAVFLRQLAPLELGGQIQMVNNLALRQIDNVRKRMAGLRLTIGGSSDLSQLYMDSAGKSYSVADMLEGSSRGHGASADGESIIGFYVSGHFGDGSHDESGYEDGYGTSTRGITAGADYRITDKFIAGVALGNNNSSLDINNDGGRVDMSGLSLLAYTSYYVTSKTYVEAIWAVHKNSLDSARNINYRINNVSRSVTASNTSDNGIAGISVGTGYEAYFKRNFTVNVSANVDVLKTAFDGYVESGAGDKNLVVDKRENSLSVYSLNGLATYAVRFPGGVLIPQLEFAWKHEFDDEATGLQAYYQVDPNRTKFTIFTEQPDTDYFQLNLGCSYVIPGGTTGYMFYEKTLGKTGYSLYNVTLGLRVPF